MKTINNTLRPGLLVSLKTSIHGNAMYSRNDVEQPHFVNGGALKAKWETEKLVEDPAEYTEGTRIRSKAANCIRNSCVQSAFGLICPEDKEDGLDQAIKDARELVDEYNQRAKITRITLYVIVGRIASNDAEAVRAINSEVKSLMDKMEQGLRSFDVKAIREAAEQARQVGQMLPQGAQKRVREAIDAAREAAKKINKAGEAARIEIDQTVFATIQGSRMAFLDVDELDEPVDLSRYAGASRSIDLQPEAEA